MVLNQIAAELLGRGVAPHAILYLSLDDNILKLVPLSEILSAYRETVLPEGQLAYLLLDEVHYAVGWDQELKTLVDHHPEYRILATGSASVEHHTAGAHAGVGRWTVVPIPTLSFYEFLNIRGEAPEGVPEDARVMGLHSSTPGELSALTAVFRPVMPAFQRYLLVGGFPETARRDDISECQRLLREDIVDRVLKRDMTSLFGVRNVNELEKLFLYMCLHTGGLLSPEKCAQQLGSHRSTVTNYLDLLVQANLLYRLSPDAVGGKKILKARHKYFLVDAALRNAVLLNGEEILQDPTEMGRIVETAVLRHLIASHYLQAPTFAYWRDPRTNREVDVVLRMPGMVIPVEVKYRDHASLDRADGLAAFCAIEPGSRGLMVTQRDTDFSSEQIPGTAARVLRIPAHIMCYLMGQSERQNAGA